MNFSDTNHRHALNATWTPPVESKGGIQKACRLSVTITDEVGVLVHIRTLGITESAPADGIEIRTLGNVEVAVHTIGEVAVVYPAILGCTAREKVAATHIDRARTYKFQVADNDVLASEEC